MMRKSPCALSSSKRRVLNAYAATSLGTAFAALITSIVGTPGSDDATGILLVVAGMTAFISAVGLALGGWRLRGHLDLFSGNSEAASRPKEGSASWVAGGAGWRVMRLTAKLMPHGVGQRWLAEAQSFLFEAPPELRRSAIGSLITHAPQVIAVAWAGKLAREVRDRAAR